MIVLDLDGVVFDFVTPAYAAHGRSPGLNEPNNWDFFEEWGLTADEFWKPINEQGPGWWRSLNTYPWVPTLLETINEADDFIVATASSHNPDSVLGKMQAIQDIFGHKFKGYFVTPQKWLLAKPGYILIDDNDDNCEKFYDHGGEAVLFPQPWNANRDMCDNRIQFVREQLNILVGEVEA
jgi:5'(3')-deoxyribonucleotidase